MIISSCLSSPSFCSFFSANCKRGHRLSWMRSVGATPQPERAQVARKIRAETETRSTPPPPSLPFPMRVPLPYPSSIPVLRSGYLNKLVLEHLRLSLHRKRVTHTARGHTLCKKELWRRVSPPNAYLCFTELALFLFERGNLLFDRLQGKGGRVTGRASNISIQECHFRGQRCLRHHEIICQPVSAGR